MVHELLHGLGMVPKCAPHWTNDNHVSETNDVMTGGIIGNSQVLDAGRDDYFRAHIPGCTDLADSPSWHLRRRAGRAASRRRRATTRRRSSFTPATGPVTSYTVTATPGRRHGERPGRSNHGLRARERSLVHLRRHGAQRHRARGSLGPEQRRRPEQPAGRPDRRGRGRGRRPGDRELLTARVVGRLGDRLLHRHGLARRQERHRDREPDHRRRARQRQRSTPSRSPRRTRLDGTAVGAVQRGRAGAAGRALIAPPAGDGESRRPGRRRAPGRPDAAAAPSLSGRDGGTFRRCRRPRHSPSSAPPRWR